MANSKYDVTAIGNAIVDVLAHAEDKFLVEQKLAKGAMSLIDPPTADRLYGLMNAGVEASGGSAANTIAGLAGLGGKGAFIGSNSALVAPVAVGEGAVIAAGSVITRDVPKDALGLGRARQEIKEGWAKARRETLESAKKK